MNYNILIKEIDAYKKFKSLIRVLRTKWTYRLKIWKISPTFAWQSPEVVTVISHTGLGVVSGMSHIQVIPDIIQQKFKYHLYFEFCNKCQVLWLFRHEARIWNLPVLGKISLKAIRAVKSVSLWSGCLGSNSKSLLIGWSPPLAEISSNTVYNAIFTPLILALLAHIELIFKISWG